MECASSMAPLAKKPKLCSSSDSSDTSNTVKKRCDGKLHVVKGSLNLEALVEAKRIASSAKTNKDDMTEEERKQERRAANRLSAFQSRERRKLIIEDLRKTVSQLSKDNTEQRDLIKQMQAEQERAKQENEQLRAQLAAHNRSAPATKQQLQALLLQKAIMLQQLQGSGLPPTPSTVGSNDLARLLQCFHQV